MSSVFIFTMALGRAWTLLPFLFAFVSVSWVILAFIVIKVLIASPSYRDTSTTLSRPVKLHQMKLTSSFNIVTPSGQVWDSTISFPY